MQSDRLLKFKVINDVLHLVTPIDWLPLTKVRHKMDYIPSRAHLEGGKLSYSI